MLVEVGRYTDEQTQTLSRQLSMAAEQIAAGALKGRSWDLALVESLHDAVFRGVVDHAGKSRRSGWGPETMQFLEGFGARGGYRSARASEVAARVAEIFAAYEAEAAAALRQENPTISVDLIRAAVRAHADLIRTQPFIDGNKRTARLVLSGLLVLHGIGPVPIEVPAQEYLACLVNYFDTHDVEPLTDLVLRLAFDQLP